MTFSADELPLDQALYARTIALSISAQPGDEPGVLPRRVRRLTGFSSDGLELLAIVDCEVTSSWIGMGENLAWSEGRELFCSEGLRERIAVSASCPQPVQRVRLESWLSEGHLHVVRLSDRRFQRNFESSYRLPGMALRSIVSAEPVGIDRLEKERIDGAPAQADEHIRGAVFGALDTYFADDRRAAGGERKADGPYRDHERRPQDYWVWSCSQS